MLYMVWDAKTGEVLGEFDRLKFAEFFAVSIFAEGYFPVVEDRNGIREVFGNY